MSAGIVQRRGELTELRIRALKRRFHRMVRNRSLGPSRLTASMELRHRSAILIAVAVLASGCVPRKTGTGDSPAGDVVPIKGEPQGLSGKSPDPPANSPPSTTREARTGEDAKQRRVDGQPERPWAHNTGPSDPKALTRSGSLKITTDGATLENLDISGTVTIDADNVTMRNFRITATSRYGIRVIDGHSGIVLEDGEISGSDSAAILGVGFSARRLHIHDGNGDGLKVQGVGGPTLVESSFIEKIGADGEGHCDGNQTRGGSNITFRGNNIYMPYPGTPSYVAPYKSNATFMLELEISNFVIERNWLTGGNYTIYCRQDGTVSVRDNVFGRENGGLSAGKENLRVRAGNCNDWSGNRWEDTGGPI